MSTDVAMAPAVDDYKPRCVGKRVNLRRLWIPSTSDDKAAKRAKSPNPLGQVSRRFCPPIDGGDLSKFHFKHASAEDPTEPCSRCKGVQFHRVLHMFWSGTHDDRERGGAHGMSTRWTCRACDDLDTPLQAHHTTTCDTWAWPSHCVHYGREYLDFSQPTD
jgi:hypothetical protein